MSAIYKIIGEDGREYGPATAEQVRQWIAEGRAEHRTPVFVTARRTGTSSACCPEFAGCFAAPAGTPPPIAPPPRGTSNAGRMAKTNSYALWGMIFGILSHRLLLLRFSFGASWPRFFAHRPFSNQREPGMARRPRHGHRRFDPLDFEPAAECRLDAVQPATIHPHAMWNAGQF